MVFLAALTIPASAQKRKKRDNTKFSELQIAQIHAGYKKLFQDSLHFSAAIADSVARIEKDFVLKKREVMQNKDIREEEKTTYYGMFDADRDAILGSFLSIYDLERYRAFLNRMEAAQKEAQKR